MNEKFRTAILGKMIEHALQDPDLQHAPDELAQWARNTYGVSLSQEEYDPMETLTYQALNHIVEYQQQQAERTQSWRRKAEPDKQRPLLPACWLAAEVTSDTYEVPGMHTTALLGTYVKHDQSFMCHKECLERLEYSQGVCELSLIGREGYTPCGGCGYPLAGPSATSSWLYPPLAIPLDIAEEFYRVPKVFGIGTGYVPQKKHQVSPLQPTLFDNYEVVECKTATEEQTVATTESYESYGYRYHKYAVVAGMLECGKCHRSKRVNQFHRNRQSHTGYHSWCKECRKA